MFRLLRIFFILCSVIFVGNAFAAGYVCSTVRKYTSCSAGYYLAVDSYYSATPQTGNKCAVCNGTYCPGGTSAPFYKVTLDPNGGTLGSISALYACASSGWYVGTTSSAAGTKLTSLLAAQLPKYSPYKFNGFWTAPSGGTQVITATGQFISSFNMQILAPVTLYAQYTDGCGAGMYMDGDECVDCPEEWPNSAYGAIGIENCYANCDLTTISNGTVAPLAETVNYGASCMYNVNCDAGYSSSSNPSSAPQCDAKCVRVTLDTGDAEKDGAIYTRYNDKNNWYSDAACSIRTSEIIKPVYDGWTFAGYYGTQLAPLKITGDALLPATSYVRVPYNSTAIVATPGEYTAGATWWARWAQNCAPTSGATCQGPIYVSQGTINRVYYINCCLPGYTNTDYANTLYADDKGVCMDQCRIIIEKRER